MRRIITAVALIFTVVAFIGFVPFKADNILPKIIAKTEKMVPFKIKAAGLKMSIFRGACISRLDLFYPNGEKFAQFDNTNVQIAFPALFKKQILVKTIKTDNVILRLKSNLDGVLYLEKYLPHTVDKKTIYPNFMASKYNVTLFTDKNAYAFKGKDLKISEIIPNKRVKFVSNGILSMSGKDYISYDLNILSQIALNPIKRINILEFLDDIQKLDFKANILAHVDLKGSTLSPKTDGIVNIDDVSITVNGKKLPNSFLYLTLLGDKISIDSEIYSDESNKLVSKGILKLGEKPSIDLKLKSDKIDLGNTFYVFKLFSEITGNEQIKTISGYLKTDCNLKGDLKKIKSNGFFNLNNVNILTDNLSINRLNSDIDFSDNVITIKKTGATVNGAAVSATGKIGKNVNIEILANKLPVKQFFAEKYGITDGIVTVIANLGGTLDNILPKVNIEVTDMRGVYKELKLKIVNANLKICENKTIDGVISSILFEHKKIKSVKIPTLRFKGGDSELEILKSSIYAPNSKVDFSGKLLNLNTEKFIFSIIGDGYINPKDFNIKNISEQQPILITASGNQKFQTINAQLLQPKSKLFEMPSIINLWAKITDKDIKISDLSINTYNGKFTKNNLKQNIATSTKLLITNGIINDINNPKLHAVKINIPKSMKFNYGDYVAQLQGDLSLNGDIKSPEIVGQLSIEKLINSSIVLAVENLEADFTKNNVELSCPNIKFKNTIMNIVANAENDLTKGIRVKNINIKSKYIDTNDFLQAKDYFVFPENLYIHTGTIYSEKVKTGLYDKSILLNDFNSGLGFEKNKFKLSNLFANMYNGKIAGNIEYDVTDDRFESMLQGRGISSRPVLNELSDFSENMSGTLDFDSKITGWIMSKDSLNGNIKFVVNDGQMSTLGKLEHLLYAQNIIADNMMRASLAVITKAVTAKDTGLFKYVRGNIVLSNGWAKIQSVQTLGPNMSMYIKGRVNLINNFADLLILGRLSDEVVTSLGTIGNFSMGKLITMLTGNDEAASLSLDFMDNVPMLPQKNTKEFKSVIYGPIESQSSVKSFKWVSYSQKNYNTKEVPMTNIGVPEFMNNIGN